MRKIFEIIYGVPVKPVESKYAVFFFFFFLAWRFMRVCVCVCVCVAIHLRSNTGGQLQLQLQSPATLKPGAEREVVVVDSAGSLFTPSILGLVSTFA